MNSKQKNMLYVSLTNSAGGAEQILMMAAKINNGPILFLKEQKNSALIINDNQCIKFLSKKSILAGFFLLIKELIPYRKNYVIMSSHPYLNAYLGILKRVGFIKSILVTRESTSVFLRFSGLKRLSYKIVYWLGYPAIDLLVCQTDGMRKQLMENSQYLISKRVVVLENPVDVEDVMKKAGEASDDPMLLDAYICSAGRLISLKAFDVLIKAFKPISKQCPDLKLLILGEGEKRGDLVQLIEKLALQDKVILKGFVSNPFRYFKNARVCVVSSIREGFPNVLLQMMALNERVVSTLCADGIQDFHSISKAKVNDVDSLTSAILYELSVDRETKVYRNKRFIAHRTPENFMKLILEKIIQNRNCVL